MPHSSRCATCGVQGTDRGNLLPGPEDSEEGGGKRSRGRGDLLPAGAHLPRAADHDGTIKALFRLRFEGGEAEGKGQGDQREP